MKYLYNLPLPEASTNNESDRLGQRLAEMGVLGEDSTSVESIASEAADLRLEGQIRWGEDISTMIATELDELADSSLGNLPLFRRGGGYSNAGYYEIASADVDPLHANQRDVWAWTLDLTFVGRQATHFRAVETNPFQVDHEFGNGLQTMIAVPTSARKVRWMNLDDKSTELAEPVETRPAANTDMGVYDLTDASWYDPPPFDQDAPVLVYESAYSNDVRAGARVYDTRGYDGKFSNSGDGPRQWQTVHTTEHDIDNPVVMSNGLLRLWIDEDAGTVDAQEWDSSTDSWIDVGLEQPASVELFDVDLTSVSMIRDHAQLTFDVAGDLFALDAIVATGAEDVLFSIPDGETGPIPTDLEDWLNPIASGGIVDVQGAKTLVRRREVRR
ncbi:hypothetical protein [Natronorubrum sp. FCH18a]|uniref:hypothetical protein n=1 Tax=Natronorubrum sp. FCH18a TaxID=3447018 RepID=UPI003F50F9C3